MPPPCSTPTRSPPRTWFAFRRGPAWPAGLARLSRPRPSAGPDQHLAGAPRCAQAPGADGGVRASSWRPRRWTARTRSRCPPIWSSTSECSRGQRHFDETAARDPAHREVGRARNIASAQNHDVLGRRTFAPVPLRHRRAHTRHSRHRGSDVSIEHGEALAEEIPRASTAAARGAGHGVHRADWETIVGATLEHTATGP